MVFTSNSCRIHEIITLVLKSLHYSRANVSHLVRARIERLSMALQVKEAILGSHVLIILLLS